MGKCAPPLPSWPCGLLEATSSGLWEHLAAVGALWPNATADNQTHTLEGGQCGGDRAVSTPLAQSLEQEHPCSLIPVSLSVSHHLSLAYPCLTLDFHLKAAEGKRDMDFLRFCFLAFNGEPGQRVLSN